MGADLLFHHRALVVEGLLNALEAERHLRRALLIELLESLCPLDSTWNPAKDSARRLLSRLDENEPLSDRDWKSAIARLREDIIPPASQIPRSAIVRKTKGEIEKKVA